MQKEQMKTLISIVVSTTAFLSRCECRKTRPGRVDHPGSAAAEASPVAPMALEARRAELESPPPALPHFDPLLSADGMSGRMQQLMLSPLDL
jgi:hypothetical protein